MNPEKTLSAEGDKLVAGRWGCFNCLQHGHQFSSPPGYTICRAPAVVRAWEAVVRVARASFGAVYRALPSWCWRDKCVICKKARVPYRESYCYDCHMAEQWAEYNSMISGGIYVGMKTWL